MKKNATPPQPKFRRRSTPDLPEEARQEVTATMRAIAAGGAAVGTVTGPEGSSLAGMTAFVPFAAPGETVKARVRKLSSRHLEADLLSVETASPERVTPRCPHFGECGGCDLQHLDYAAQLRAKQEMVIGALRFGSLGEAVTSLVEETVPSPAYEYRQRITLHVDRAGRCGYHKRRSHDLLIPSVCPIAYAAIDKWLAAGFSYGDTLDGVESDLMVEAAENGLFGVLTVPVHLKHDKVAAAIARMEEHFVGGRIQYTEYTLGRFGAEEMIRTAAGVETHSAPGVFSQVNPAVNTALVGRALQAAQATGAKTAYDLYAGAGNFALRLAGAGIRVFAVESDPVLVTVGRAETVRAGAADRVVFIQQDMTTFLSRKVEPVDFAIADPPRAGLGELAAQFEFCGDLVLVSCQLASAVRDIKLLRENGWEVRSITPFDMFAQTAYVELLTVLHRTAK